MFKQKRAFTGEGATNTPAGATNQAEAGSMVDVQQMPSQAQQQQLRGSQTAGTTQDESLLDIPVEQALAAADQMLLPDFILMAQRMLFRVRV